MTYQGSMNGPAPDVNSTCELPSKNTVTLTMGDTENSLVLSLNMLRTILFTTARSGKDLETACFGEDGELCISEAEMYSLNKSTFMTRFLRSGFTMGGSFKAACRASINAASIASPSATDPAPFPRNTRRKTPFSRWINIADHS